MIQIPLRSHSFSDIWIIEVPITKGENKIKSKLSIPAMHQYRVVACSTLDLLNSANSADNIGGIGACAVGHPFPDLDEYHVACLKSL